MCVRACVRACLRAHVGLYFDVCVRPLVLTSFSKSQTVRMFSRWESRTDLRLKIAYQRGYLKRQKNLTVNRLATGY